LVSKELPVINLLLKNSHPNILLKVVEDLARNLSEQMKYFAGQVDFASRQCAFVHEFE
jgi:hypothetical protein